MPDTLPSIAPPMPGGPVICLSPYPVVTGVGKPENRAACQESPTCRDSSNKNTADERRAHVFPTGAPLADLTVAPTLAPKMFAARQLLVFALYVLAGVIRHQGRRTEAQDCTQEYVDRDSRGGFVCTE